jgi:hypothetical protein
MQDNRRGGGQRRDFNDRGDQRGGRRDFGGPRRGPGREYPDRSDAGMGARDFPRERPYRSDRPYGGDRGGAARTGGRPGPRSGSDEGGMAIRLDPRRLSLLKELAGEQGMRPGELVTEWVQQRLDAERTGGASGGQTAGSTRADVAQGSALAALSARVDDLSQRLNELMAGGARPGSVVTPKQAATPKADSTPPPASAAADVVAEPPRTKRPRKAGAGAPSDLAAAAAVSAPAPSEAREPLPRRRRAAATRVATVPTGTDRRVPLHEEIASVISEGGPMSAAQIAQAIVDRGRYAAPRSDRPLDAATVNSRVSNPIYRSRFRREDGKIGLSD